MIKLTRYHLILIGLLILGTFLRLYKLGEVPAGLYIDEPSLGYNAYTILTSGRDEHGIAWPISFQAYGEYKLPGYIYLSTPFIAIFGLNSFSIRLLSALAGSCSILLIYLLTTRILKPLLTKTDLLQTASLLTAALFALSPWSLQFSRAAFEANLALAFLLAALYFFLRKTTITSLILSAFFFVFAFYTYNSTRFLMFLFIPGLLAIYWQNQTFKQRIVFLSPLVLLCLPGLIALFFGEDAQRAKQVFELEHQLLSLGPLIGTLYKYFTHFSPEFLFFSGDLVARHGVKELGPLLLPQMFFLIIGAYHLIKSSHLPETRLLLLWLLLAPLPAAVATPVPHALRTLNLLPPLLIITALGIVQTIQWSKQKRYGMQMCSILLVTIFSYSLLTYFHVYYGHYAKQTSWDWGEHHTRLAQYLTRTYPDAEHIYIESDPRDIIYIKFFNASRHQPTSNLKYLYVQKLDDNAPQNGDIVALSGWKGTPKQLTNVKKLEMLNTSIGFQVGVWQNK